mmetsp:Transcript_40607/g.84987  ORF Transcript_40607/g.84987 Transcript_40607/m.84987 type:complete len:148 (-) Transcript_40607:40-483(-)
MCSVTMETSWGVVGLCLSMLFGKLLMNCSIGANSWDDDDDADDDADDDQNNDTQNRKRKQFDFIFYQSGVDIHANDRLGRLSVTSDGISKRNAMVFDFANRMECPLVVCMGGGYPKGEDWTSVIEAHANVYWEAHRYLADAHSKIVS